MGIWPLARLAEATAPPPRSTTALSLAMPAVVLTRGERIVRIVRLGGGTLAADLTSTQQADLRAYRTRHGLPFVAAVDLDQLPAVWAEVQAAVRPEEDYVAQLLAMAHVLREALGRGALRLDPRAFGRVPLPSYALLQATFNQLLPDDRSFSFYLVDGGRIWTSLIAVKREGDLTLVTSHAAIADRVHLSSIRADAPAVVRVISERFAPVHIGVFLPLRTWHELVAGDRSAIARALASRQAVVDPAPSWLKALVGAGAVAEAATRSVRLAGKLLSASGLGARLLGGAAAAERLVQTVSNPLEALGLDPWDLLRWARDWARRIELERERLGGHGSTGG
jgi:hypothetical protein